jgi:hypothetical protein
MMRRCKTQTLPDGTGVVVDTVTDRVLALFRNRRSAASTLAIARVQFEAAAGSPDYLREVQRLYSATVVRRIQKLIARDPATRREEIAKQHADGLLTRSEFEDWIKVVDDAVEEMKQCKRRHRLPADGTQFVDITRQGSAGLGNPFVTGIDGTRAEVIAKHRE